MIFAWRNYTDYPDMKVNGKRPNHGAFVSLIHNP